MKQVEITVPISGDLETLVKELETKGVMFIKRGRVEDIYLSQETALLTKDNILEILSNSVLLRYLKRGARIYTKITYKNKSYNKQGELLAEEKINLLCDDLSKAKELFSVLGFRELVKVNYDFVRMGNDYIELALQDVEGLGFC